MTTLSHDLSAAQSEQAADTIAPRSAPLSGFNGTRRVPHAGQRAGQAIRAGLARARRAQGAAQVDGRRARRHSARHRRQGDPHRRHGAGRDAARRTATCSADWHKASATHVQQAIEAAREARARVVELGVGRSRRGLPQGRRAARHDLARDAQRRDDARPVEDGVPGRDRRGVRADRLLALQRRVRAGALRRAADQSNARRCGTSSTTAPLEGFVYAVTPFNFTAIGGNLPTAPALMGNTVIWKPASSAMLSAYYLMKLLEAAGLPPGVINFVPGDAAEISTRAALAPRSRRRALHRQHRRLQQHVEDDRREHGDATASYPRIVGETGGKDFIVAHPSADRAGARGRDRARRLRVPGAEVLGGEPRLRAAVALERRARSHGRDDGRDHGWATCATSATSWAPSSTRSAFDKISELPRRRAARTRRSSHGGDAKGDEGYFIEPTLIETTDPGYRLLCEEIFGPVVTAYVYDDAKWDETLDDRRPDVAVRAHRRGVRAAIARAVREATMALRNAAGNFYINDKPTGAVVGQQPFGGARGVGHERQGRLEAQPRALGERADDQGDVLAAARLQVSVHGGGVREGWFITR